MNEQIYEYLKQDKKFNPLIDRVLLIVGAILTVLGFALFHPVRGEGYMFLAFVGMWCILIVLFRLMAKAGYHKSLKKSLATLERTGSINYIGEITNRAYTVADKCGFSEHLVYLPGVAVLAYQDIVKIYSVKMDYYFVTTDTQKHRLRITSREAEQIQIRKDNLLRGAKA